MNYVNENLGGEDYVWFKVRDLIISVVSNSPPDPKEYECHLPKPVLLPTGWMDKPYNWHPETVELGLYRYNDLFIACKRISKFIQSKFRKAGRVWCGGARETH